MECLFWYSYFFFNVFNPVKKNVLTFQWIKNVLITRIWQTIDKYIVLDILMQSGEKIYLHVELQQNPLCNAYFMVYNVLHVCLKCLCSPKGNIAHWPFSFQTGSNQRNVENVPLKNPNIFDLSKCCLKLVWQLCRNISL